LPPPCCCSAAALRSLSAVESSAGEQQLDEATALYKQGDYTAAIKRLQGAPDIWNGAPDMRVRAHKLLAFSYCVTNHRSQCRQQFERVLELSPGFELSPAEAGHPIWGAEFREAKRLQGSKAAK
jgi:Tfp pilus assembly protein PilF